MEMSLFEPEEKLNYKPLAVRMRPLCLKDVLGQDHVLGEKSLLPRLVKANHFGSLLFYGPPGSGKTTLAEAIANETGSKFVKINAILSNVGEVRDILKMARYREGKGMILFIDEIHRFNKAQQDLLLPDVEEGNIRLIGATTHNPGFYIIKPLLSRSHLFRLEPVASEIIEGVLRVALMDKERGLGHNNCKATAGVLSEIARMSDGDMRRALNALETLVLSQPKGSTITEETVAVFAHERQIRYDANEEEHYDTISAFIKSIRGCDPDAALYWLAKMVEGGEDPRFIARRLVVLASEDVGLADSRGLSLAVAAYQACEIIGMPECVINLAHATVFLSVAPKSNASYLGIKKAQEAIRKAPVQSVPEWLKDKGGVGAQMGNGKGYLYSHDYEEGISGQEYMYDPIHFYEPKGDGAEEAIKVRLDRWKSLKLLRSKGHE